MTIIVAVDRERLTGIVDGFLFESPSSLFKIVSIKITKASFTWNASTIIVTGNFGDLNLEETYDFTGTLIEHPKYGRQFQAETYQQERPNTAASLIQYFSSEQFQGVGKVTATKIVKVLGTDAITKVLADPQAIQAVGLKSNLAQVIVKTLEESHGTEQMMLGLTELGFGSRLISQIIQKYHDQAMTVIRENPYQLVYDIQRVGFKRADQVALKLNIAADAPIRIRAAIIQYLRQDLMVSGNTYSSALSVLDGATDILEESRSEVPTDQQLADELISLAGQGSIIVKDKRIYLAAIYHGEFKIAQQIKQLTTTSIKPWAKQTFEKEVKAIQRWFKVDYNQEQLAAIEQALDAPISILTGGPGTGKTTILNAVVALFAKKHQFSLDVDPDESDEFPIQLSAPTGRAAKRLNETTGLPAKTIHRLLGLGRTDDQYALVDPQPIQGKLLIIDEMSMVDQQLFEALLQAIPEGMQVLLVGDQDQLPSVGPGRVFADLISSQAIPVTFLTEIYRQSANSTIIDLARDIKEGHVPDNLTANLPDRSFFVCQPGQVEHIVSQVISRAKSHFSLTETQILAPMYRGAAGIDQLNLTLQAQLNPRKTSQTKEVKVGKVVYRIGDKVIQLVNDGQRGIYNGDIGRITGIQEANQKNDHQERLIIDFSGTEVSLPRADWLNLGLAYCVSIHKSQGSEYQLVILPLTLQSQRMLQRKLLYTAVTRAKDKLVLIGQKEAFARAILNEGTERRTTLVDQIRHECRLDGAVEKVSKKEIIGEKSESQKNSQPKNSYRLTAELIALNEVDPMIGMEKFTLGTSL